MLTPEARRRWTLILGTSGAKPEPSPLSELDQIRDEVLGDLFDQVGGSGQGTSAPYVARWLEDLRGVVPQPLFRWIERECWDRWGPKAFLATGHHEPDAAIA